MTRPVSPAADQRAALARDDADAAIEHAGELPDVERRQRLDVIATDLLYQYGPEGGQPEHVLYALRRLAMLGAELAVRLHEQAAVVPVDEPIPLMPDDGIRLAHDYPGFGG